MSFRTKVFLSITAAVVLAVWLVAVVVSALVTQSFERQDAQRTTSLVAQFRREFDRRGADVARRIDAVANSDAVERLAVNLGGGRADTAQYYSQAQALAQEQSLDFLELVGPEEAIISSAEWPARFGYKEDWLAQPVDWKTQSVFLKQEDLADGSALGLIAVRTLKAGDGSLYVAGGQRLDKEFLDSLPVAQGMRVQLYRNFAPLAQPESLGSKLAANLVKDVQHQPHRDDARRLGRHHHGDSAYRPRPKTARHPVGGELTR